jgi:hypothetical protein
MPNVSRERLRQAAARLRAGPHARVEAKLRKDIADLERHTKALERRLHVAEHTVGQLSTVGLIGPGLSEPANFARWLTWRPPGHESSPVPDVRELEAAAERLWPEKLPTELAGIDLRPDEQLETFSTIAKVARTFDVNDRLTEPWRYHSSNDSYGVGDALTLHGMLRHVRPARIVAVGGGFALAMILDTIEHYLGGRTDVTFIERDAEALQSMLRAPDRDRLTVIAKAVHDVALDTFTGLQAGDMLFLEPSHVLKTGSDVAWVYAHILPRLNAGVYVHIHGIFYPFEYPREWVMEGRAYSELYVVRAFLALNSDFEIVLFNDWLAKLHEDRIAAELPAMSGSAATALWLRRTCTSPPVLAL